MASSKLREPADEVFGKFCLALSLAKAAWPLVWGGWEESRGDVSVCVSVYVVVEQPDSLSHTWT